MESVFLDKELSRQLEPTQAAFLERPRGGGVLLSVYVPLLEPLDRAVGRELE